MSTEPEFVQKIIDMYSSGIEQKEITERTGQTYCVVRYWLKKKGLYDPNRRVHNTDVAHRERVVHQKQDAENKLALFLLDKGFKYIDGYKGKNSHILTECLTCGGTFTKYVESVSHFNTISCPICAEKKRAARLAEEDVERAKKREAYEKQLEIWRKAREERELEKVRRLDESHICPICSKTFTIREYAKSIGTDPIFIPNVEYCSDKCRRKASKMSGHSRDHIKRAVQHGCEWERGVTLKKLLKRDGLRCAICGEMCDINDKSWGNGNGPRYPSMDHIIPIAKGGSHTWNNVQVAHLLCNTLKNVKII